jgi:FkbM family methyltransferase
MVQTVMRLARRAVRRLGIDVVRYVPPLQCGFDVLSLVVRDRLAHDPDLFVLQIGANDGLGGDPLRQLIMQHDLAGLLVEPLPDIFEALRANYADRPRLRFANVAIAAHAGVRPFYRVRPGTAGVPSWWFGVAGFDRRVLTSNGIPLEAIDTIRIATTTLTELLTEHGVKRVDLLQVDAEGQDGAIVLAALDAGLTPAIINYESCHLPPREQYAVRQRLAAAGYGFVEIQPDTLAVRATPR